MISVFRFQSGEVLAGGFELRISPEAGFFNQSVEGVRHGYFCSSALFSSRYKYRFPHQQLVFDLKFKPEFYSGAGAMTMLSINGQASYKRLSEKLDIELALSRRQMNYYENRFGLYAQITQVLSCADWKISPFAGIRFQPKYVFRSLTGENEHTVSSAIVDILFVYTIQPTLVISAGPAFEHYTIRIPFRAVPPSHNSGITAGPTIQVSYQDASIFRCSYGMLKRNSNPVDENSIEHRFHGLWGSPISKKWSAFFFLEYTLRNFRNKADRDNDLFYSLSDNENRIFAKISYEWASRSEWFLKAGYLSYGLYQSSARLSGFQITTGCDFQF